ncbi:unnamed protein product [Parnassius apollo]|uniref:(apollo) hypothetical protein n=1 Tax=Parnassius apollo TaxID=110799 RepID=A0A8S3WUX0_PARAO|nr:unnamed protein product [Parnassius apollo]
MFERGFNTSFSVNISNDRLPMNMTVCEVKTISHCDFTFLTRKISQSQSLSLTQSTSENGHQCVSGSSSVV